MAGTQSEAARGVPIRMSDVVPFPLSSPVAPVPGPRSGDVGGWSERAVTGRPVDGRVVPPGGGPVRVRPAGIVTIDGPAGAGKSTVARALAERLGWQRLDTGAMFRAVAWALEISGQGFDAAGQVVPETVRAALAGLDFRLDANGVPVVDGRALGAAELRDPTVEARVSPLSQVPEVRALLRDRQRAFAAELLGRGVGLVCEGRDMGTVVFPDARFKIYLDADLTTRAARRARERGEEVDRVRVADELAARDRRDRERAEAPLKPADDARIVDTTGLDVEQVVSRLLAIVAPGIVAPGDAAGSAGEGPR